jgi:arginine decarboxylase
MDAAQRLHARYKHPSYRQEYAAWKAKLDAAGGIEKMGLDQRLLPDPAAVRIRAYATQSTHKTLTSLRQGSMIHVHDQDFEHGVRSVFNEAYMTHTSTSPNYQILASLDMGRRQVELEGYELVLKSIELAMTLRERVRSDALLQKYFRVLGPGDMIPSALRPSGIEAYFDPARGWSRMEDAWTRDEFVLDPTRITLDIGRTGLDGDTFKALLIDRFDIQINKTSRNSVLFMVHIGMTRGTVSNLVKVLTTIARDLDDRQAHQSDAERVRFDRKVRSLTVELPPLPNFSRFHPAFQPAPDTTTPEGDMRDAFFLAYDDAACGHVPLDRALFEAVKQGREVVSASFVTPYPPGFPVLMPGQVMTADILNYLLELDVKEIHGYEPAYGLRIFKPAALAALVEESAEFRRAAASDREGVQA